MFVFFSPNSWKIGVQPYVAKVSGNGKLPKPVHILFEASDASESAAGASATGAGATWAGTGFHQSQVSQMGFVETNQKT